MVVVGVGTTLVANPALSTVNKLDNLQCVLSVLDDGVNRVAQVAIFHCSSLVVAK